MGTPIVLFEPIGPPHLHMLILRQPATTQDAPMPRLLIAIVVSAPDKHSFKYSDGPSAAPQHRSKVTKIPTSFSPYSLY